MTGTWMIAIAFGLLGACGQDAVPQGGRNVASSRKPCDYLARADAEAALELALPGTTETEVTGECNYHNAEFYGVTFATGTWEGVMQSANTGGQNHPPVAVPGIGDEAVSQGSHLYVRKGERGLMVSLNGPAVDADSAKAIARARGLAVKVLAKM